MNDGIIKRNDFPDSYFMVLNFIYSWMKNLILFLFPILLFISCGKELETITVNPDTSDLFTSADSVFTANDTTDDDDFMHIKLGEIAAIESLDPLFASSNSEWRIINLLYESLLDLDEEGTPAPKLAKRWEVNTDSTQFTFHLKTNVYFHDSPVFESGNGRRFTAKDVRFIFERMASNKVPDFTGQNFTDIRGFSSYQNELTFVKDPAKRVIESINGINVRNDSTIIFNLIESAPDFLHRLAHPMASIYPRESVPSENGPIRQAAGTGSFTFIKKEGNAHLLTVNANTSEEMPNFNRVDIISGLSEKDLFQEFARINLDALIEVGPSTLITATDSTGQLLRHYSQKYILNQASAESSYTFYFNKNSGQARQVNKLISVLDVQSLLENPALGTLFFNKVDSTSAKNKDNTQFIITHTGHAAKQFLLDKLATEITNENFSLSMNASYALFDNITFSTLPYPGTQKFLQWTAPVYILSHEGAFSGIEINHAPWNLDLSSVKRSGGI